MNQVRRLPDWVKNSYDLELYHHGIIGQKWGKMHGPPYPLERGISAAIKRHKEAPKIGFAKGRNADGTKKFKNDKRYQNADGTLNKAGKEKFGSYEEFDRQRREKAKKVLKAVAITAGVTLGAAAVYYGANKVRQEFIGQTIKNMRAQRITSDAINDAAVKGRMYVADNVFDKARYRGMYGAGTIGARNGKYAINNISVKNVKMAPNRTARKEFAKLYDNDKSFRDVVDKAIKAGNMSFNNSPGQARAFDKAANTKDAIKKYDAFNIANSFNMGEGNKEFEKFYDALKKKGFNGIYDLNDNQFSGYGSRSAKILFPGQDAKVLNTEIVKEGTNKFNKDLNKGMALFNAKNIAKDPSVVGYTAAGGAYSAYEANKFKKAEKNKSTVKRKTENPPSNVKRKNEPHKLSVRDIDDEELIDLYIDEPSFRKEYNISESEYRRYKKSGELKDLNY